MVFADEHHLFIFPPFVRTLCILDFKNVFLLSVKMLHLDS